MLAAAEPESGETSSDAGPLESGDGESQSGESGNTQSDDESEAESGGESSREEESNSSHTHTSSAAETSSKTVSSKKPTSSRKPAQQPEYDDDYEQGGKDSSYVEVDSDMLVPPGDTGNITTSSTPPTGASEHKTKTLGSSIAAVIWIPALLAVASAAGLVAYNVNYRRKYGKYKSGGKKRPPARGNGSGQKKKPQTRIYIPRD